MAAQRYRVRITRPGEVDRESPRPRGSAAQAAYREDEFTDAIHGGAVRASDLSRPHVGGPEGPMNEAIRVINDGSER